MKELSCAKFEANKYTVNFKDRDGTVLEPQQTACNTAVSTVNSTKDGAGVQYVTTLQEIYGNHSAI